LLAGHGRLSKAVKIAPMSEPAPPAETAPALPAPRDRLLAEVAALPGLPGVYRWFDAQGGLLYVGKARNLKKRVSSYLHKDHGGTRIGQMVARIARLETTVVRTEAEALLLENNLIKTLAPRFNILFRDDKSYPYLKITGARAAHESATQAQRFPRMAYFPRRGRPQAPLLRPLPQRLGGEADHPADAEGLPPAHLRRHGLQQPFAALPAVPDPALFGPLRGLDFSPPTTQRDVRDAERFLQGEQQEVVNDLQAQMMAHAEALEFEKAAELRDRIGSLSRVLHQQAMDESSFSAGDRDVDILAVKVGGGRACVNLAMVRGSRHLGDRAYFPQHVDDGAALMPPPKDDEGRGQAGVPPNLKWRCWRPSSRSTTSARPCRRNSSPATRWTRHCWRPWAKPPTCACARSTSRASSAASGWRWRPRAPRSHWRGCWPKKVRSNSARARWSRRWTWTSPTRRNCASSVSTSATRRAKRRRPRAWSSSSTRCKAAQYRRFNIEGITGGDDYAAMRQVLTRRYARLAEAVAAGRADEARGGRSPVAEVAAGMATRGTGRGPGASQGRRAARARLPDLVLVDGGRGQVAMAREVFEELGLDMALIVGVEKGEGRKVGSGGTGLCRRAREGVSRA
jgi:excinuclease ABC subunit C